MPIFQEKVRNRQEMSNYVSEGNKKKRKEKNLSWKKLEINNQYVQTV